MPRKSTSTNSSKSTRGKKAATGPAKKKKTAANSTRKGQKASKPATATSKKNGGGSGKRYTSSRLHSLDTQQYEADELLVPELLDAADDGHGAQVRDARARFRQVTQQIDPARDGRDGRKKGSVGLGTGILHGIFNRVRQLKAAHPDLAVELDLNEWKIRQRLQNIRSLLASADLEAEDRELFIALEVNYVQRMCEEILVDPHGDDPADAEPAPAGKRGSSGLD